MRGARLTPSIIGSLDQSVNVDLSDRNPVLRKEAFHLDNVRDDNDGGCRVMSS